MLPGPSKAGSVYRLHETHYAGNGLGAQDRRHYSVRRRRLQGPPKHLPSALNNMPLSARSCQSERSYIVFQCRGLCRTEGSGNRRLRPALWNEELGKYLLRDAYRARPEQGLLWKNLRALSFNQRPLKTVVISRQFEFDICHRFHGAI